MNRNTQKLIEDKLSGAVDIYLHPTPDYDKEPPTIKFSFKNPKYVFDAWEYLHKFFSNSESTAQIYLKRNEKLDISFVSKKSAETINLKGIKFHLENIADFEKLEPSNRKIMLLMGPEPAKEFYVALPDSIQSPLIIDSYKIHRP